MSEVEQKWTLLQSMRDQIDHMKLEADDLEREICEQIPKGEHVQLGGEWWHVSNTKGYSWKGIDDRRSDAEERDGTMASYRADFLRWLRDIRIVDPVTGEVASEADKLRLVHSTPSASKARTLVKHLDGDWEDWVEWREGPPRLKKDVRG